MLRCIRCGACMNHCPVYHAVGGHAYGWVYPGPMGAVLTPTLIGVDKAGHLPNASTFCGRCEERLPGQHPAAEADAPLARARVRAPPDAGDRARRPRLVGLLRQAPCALPARRRALAMGAWAFAGRKRALLAGCRSAAAGRSIRDFPAPQGETFQARWRRERKGRAA